MRRLFGAVAVVMLYLLAAPAALAQSQYQSQAIDDQALAIANELQCPVCQNVTVAYSNSTLAAEMRQVIRDKLTQGESHDAIVQYFVDRYGEGILTSPPKHGLNLLVWLLPAAGLLLGLGAVACVLLARKPLPDAEPTLTPLSEDDERLLERALKGAE